jgi:uncharacterized membrane protein YfcA
LLAVGWEDKYCSDIVTPPQQGDALPATLLFLVIGLLAGVLSGVFGIGGGVVIVPALIFIVGLSPITATGTSLAALLLPVGALGAMEYYRRGHLNVPAALWIALGLFLGAWFGAKLANQLAPIYLRRAFAVFLVLIAGRMWFV